MLTKVKHAVIPVEDQDRALEFYTKKLGFEVVVDASFEGSPQRWIELKTPEGDACVVLFTSDDQKSMIGKFSNIVFTCKDVVSTTELLREQGVVVDGPKEEPWGTYSIFKDSEGNQFCVSST